jgi:hypothetical protein
MKTPVPPTAAAILGPDRDWPSLGEPWPEGFAYREGVISAGADRGGDATGSPTKCGRHLESGNAKTLIAADVLTRVTERRG